MTTKSKQIDAYIFKSQDFAKPILSHFRELVHKACPQVEEKMKWSFPHFDYRGQMMCSIAAFKQHVAIGFWKAQLMSDKSLVATAKTEEAMGHLGRITSLKDLPADKILINYIKEGMKLNDEGKVIPRPKLDEKTKKELTIPKELIAALNKNKKAKEIFKKFAYSHKKEYIQWITEAKTEETKNKRVETTVEWVSEGKGRNWKYAGKR